MVIIVEFILFFLRMINTFCNNVGKALDIYCSYVKILLERLVIVARNNIVWKYGP